MARHKRRRGGQPGNQNARKHGLYSRNMTPQEIAALSNTPGLEGKDLAMLALRNKVQNAIASAPQNSRVLREGSGLLAKYSCSKLGLDRELTGYVKKIFRNILKASATGDVELTNRIVLETLQGIENLPYD